MSIGRFTAGDILILTSDRDGETVKIRESLKDGIALIEPEGRLSSEMAQDIEDEFTTMAILGDRVTIDLGKVNYISNAVIRVLLDLQHLIDERKGNMVLRNLSDEVYGTFEDMGIEDVFMITEE